MITANFSQLPVAGPLTGNEIVPMMQGGITVQSVLAKFLTVLSPSGDTTGATDTAAFQAAYAAAALAGKTVVGFGGTPHGTVTITLNAGIFYVNAAIMTTGQPVASTTGLVWRGQGSDITTVYYTPTVAGPLCTNLEWQNVQFTGLTFICNSVTSDFFDAQSPATASQFFNFYDVNWYGSWQHICFLTGTNNNSEWDFNRCTVYCTSIVDWVNVPTPAGSDQFLNFWFSHCRFWVNGNGSWINMALGGHIHMHKCDVSAWAPTVDTYLFNLTGISHAQGVCAFECDSFRIEHASDHALLLFMQWPQGTVTFRDLDQSPSAASRTPTVQYVLAQNTNTNGPTIEFQQCMLAGVHAYATNTSNYQFTSRYVYRMCTLLQQTSAAAFISWTQVGANGGGAPQIRFQDCRTMGFSGAHPIIDCDLFWNSIAGGQTYTKIFSLNDASGFPISSATALFQLPLNVVITQIRFWQPTNAQTGAFQYLLRTGEAVPTTLAGGAGTPMAGANAGAAIALYQGITAVLPFIVTTTAQATLSLIEQVGRATPFAKAYLLIDYIG